jgi:hypothetical protein
LNLRCAKVIDEEMFGEVVVAIRVRVHPSLPSRDSRTRAVSDERMTVMLHNHVPEGGFIMRNRFSLSLSCALALATTAFAGDGSIHRMPKHVPHRYIIGMREGESIDDAVSDFGTRPRARVLHALRHVSQVVVEIDSEADAKAISRDPRVAFVQEDGVLEPLINQYICNIPPQRLPADGSQFNLDRIDGFVDQLYLPGPPTGGGATIIIMDSGIVRNHSEFMASNGSPRVIDWKDFAAYLTWQPATPFAAGDEISIGWYGMGGKRFVVAGGGTSGGTQPDWSQYGDGAFVYDGGVTWQAIAFQSGGTAPHGTAVASVAAGNTVGVARNASLVDIRIARESAWGQTGPATDGAVSQAVDYILAMYTGMRSEIMVVNFSYGTYDDDQSLISSLERLTATNHVLLTIAAGNRGVNVSNESPAKAHASANAWLVVGASDSYDNATSYSNFGALVDVYAPGGTGSLSGGRPPLNQDPFGGAGSLLVAVPSGFDTESGTSFSAPLVAGIAARMLSGDSASFWYSANSLAAGVVNNALTARHGAVPIAIGVYPCPNSNY